MLRISTVTRISLSLTLGAISLLMTAHFIGLVPDVGESEGQNRRALCESVAIQCCVAVQKNDIATLRTLIETLVERNPQIVSAAVQRGKNTVLVKAGDHPAADENASGDAPSGTVATVPIFKGHKEWGRVEIQFHPTHQEYLTARFGSPIVPLIICLGGMIFLANVWYLRKVLTYIDPSSVIPDRVQRTLDTLTEAVVLMDKDERVVMANEKFSRLAERPANELMGQRISQLRWVQEHSENVATLPWVRTLRDGTSEAGVILRIAGSDRHEQIFAVNSAAIFGSDGARRGALVTFDDLTSLEEKNAALVELLTALEKSREEIRAQNDELQFLATRDPLTHCLNRRSFFSQVELAWGTDSRRRPPLGCVMVDVDHFKTVNDNHGHAMGDRILQHVAAVLRAGVREDDLVCRYGGEEFCLVLRNQGLAAARATAERIRVTLLSTACEGLYVTASFGVAVVVPASENLREVMEQADRSLYASKHHGRNRVTTWQELVDRGESEMRPAETHTRSAAETCDSLNPISLKAINALFTALTQRDVGTAEHSRRVANLCMVVAQDLLSERDCFILEAAALLHDVGKVGVPDSVLLKAGPLTADEWKVMATHAELGSELVQLAFGCDELREVIRTHHSWFAGDPRMPHLPSGEDISRSARILSIADAYDAMVSDRVYRRGRSRDDAIKELRRCAGKQFDPKLVERFAALVTATSQRPAKPTQLPVSVATHAPPVVTVAADEETSMLVESLQAVSEMRQSLAETSAPESSRPAVPTS